MIDVERRIFVQFQTRLQRIGEHFGHHVVLAAPSPHNRLVFVRKHLPEDVADELLHNIQRDRRYPRPGDQHLFADHLSRVVRIGHQVAPLIAAHVTHEPFVIAAFPVQLRPVVQAGIQQVHVLAPLRLRAADLRHYAFRIFRRSVLPARRQRPQTPDVYTLFSHILLLFVVFHIDHIFSFPIHQFPHPLRIAFVVHDHRIEFLFLFVDFPRHPCPLLPAFLLFGG